MFDRVKCQGNDKGARCAEIVTTIGSYLRYIDGYACIRAPGHILHRQATAICLDSTDIFLGKFAFVEPLKFRVSLNSADSICQLGLFEAFTGIDKVSVGISDLLALRVSRQFHVILINPAPQCGIEFLAILGIHECMFEMVRPGQATVVFDCDFCADQPSGNTGCS